MHTLFVPQKSFHSHFVVKGHSTGFLCLTQHLKHSSSVASLKHSNDKRTLSTHYLVSIISILLILFWILCWQEIVFCALIRDTHTRLQRKFLLNNLTFSFVFLEICLRWKQPGWNTEKTRLHFRLWKMMSFDAVFARREIRMISIFLRCDWVERSNWPASQNTKLAIDNWSALYSQMAY